MAWDHFLQAAARITQLVRSRQSAEPAVGREVRALVSASSKGGEWRTKQAENAISRSHLAWPLRHGLFSGPPGEAALAAYPCEGAGFEHDVLYGCGPAQVGFGDSIYPPFIASPFLLEVNSVPSHCGSRALKGPNRKAPGNARGTRRGTVPLRLLDSLP